MHRRIMEYLLENKTRTPDGSLKIETRFPAQSIWFDGHFPANPILPGVAQIWMVAQEVNHCLSPDEWIGGFKRVRFKHPLKPDDRLQVTISATGDPLTRHFRIQVETELACSGMVLLQNRKSLRKKASEGY